MPSTLSNSFFILGQVPPIIGFALLGLIILAAPFFAGIILLGIVNRVKDKHRRRQMKLIQNFQPDQVDLKKLPSYTSYDLLSKIAVDKPQQKIYVWIPDSIKDKKISKAYAGMPYVIKTYNFTDLLAIKFTEDGHRMASAQRDTHYTNFLLRKIREETSTNQAANPPIDKTKSMDLEIIVNDNMKPKHVIRFYHELHRPLRKDSAEYEALSKELHKWFHLLQAIIHETEQNVRDKNIEQCNETSDLTLTAGKFNEPIAVGNTQITMEVEPKQYSLHLSEESATTTAKNSECLEDGPKQEQTEAKPTSYFEQLVEKNRRQLRGDYTDE